ncbi:hypothetical protein QVD17_37934 [Tagetes erecta]|uniref:Uncharacterized protein n=1 Tax=Tagetes erecta TaxID=13708 RepID=A0AAD8JZ72_TARER|nr:hypothetical protein QVD17_37934 [Tagetes erecta]
MNECTNERDVENDMYILDPRQSKWVNNGCGSDPKIHIDGESDCGGDMWRNVGIWVSDLLEEEILFVNTTYCRYYVHHLQNRTQFTTRAAHHWQASPPPSHRRANHRTSDGIYSLFTDFNPASVQLSILLIRLLNAIVSRDGHCQLLHQGSEVINPGTLKIHEPEVKRCENMREVRGDINYIAKREKRK